MCDEDSAHNNLDTGVGSSFVGVQTTSYRDGCFFCNVVRVFGW